MADFTEEKIQKVWEKGIIDSNAKPEEFRKDTCGAWMARNEYGKETDEGWEIDHVYPASKGGDNELENLRPMNWANNRSKGDDFPSYSCAVTSDGNENVSTTKRKTVNEELQKALSNRYGN